MHTLLSRRQLLKVSAFSGVALTTGLCQAQATAPGRFSARPHAPTLNLGAGEHALAAANGRSSLLYIPPNYDPGRPAPLYVMCHGARGDGEGTLAQERAAADERGVVLLCPSTFEGTWDAIGGDFTHDFTALDALLAQTFDRCNLDPSRLAIGGFSDGASYGLTLGLMNGNLFTHVIAHSPGFIISDNWEGKPKIYVSHGRQDTVLPFDRCGAVIAARLERENYAVRFDTFDGGHTASPELRSAALGWLSAA